MLHSVMNNLNQNVQPAFGDNNGQNPQSKNIIDNTKFGNNNNTTVQDGNSISSSFRRIPQLSDLLNNNSNPSTSFPLNSATPNNESIKKKPRRKSSSANEDKVLISTSSPEGIAAASQITPNRIANILLKEGPLPIRHLTAHLVSQVPTFGSLSLSKQRRLIMAALESGDTVTSCIFEKIGWGQWEARVVNEEAVKLKIANMANMNNSGNNGSNNNNNSINNHNNSSVSNFSDKSSPQSPQLKIENPGSNYSTSDQLSTSLTDSRLSSSAPQSKFKNSRRYSSHTGTAGVLNVRRESITTSHNDIHGTKVPTSPTLLPLQSFRNSLKNISQLDEAIEFSSSSDDDDDISSNNHSSPPGEEDNGLFNFENDHQLKSKPALRSSSVSSTSRRPSFAGVVKPRKPRTSFTSHPIEAKLDESSIPIDRRGPRVSFSNSSALSRQSFLRTNILPRNNGSTTQISNIINGTNNSAVMDDGENFTDEEDWEAIGPSSLRKARQSSIITPPTPGSTEASYVSSLKNSDIEMMRLDHPKQNYETPGPGPGPNARKTDEELAAIALMDLKTV